MVESSVIVQEYLSGKSQREIAEQQGVSQQWIGKMLKGRGVVARRTKSQVNEGYFDKIDSEEKAYWLGFLVADGWIAKNKAIGLSLKKEDKRHVQLFAKSIGCSVKERRAGSEVFVLFKSVKLWCVLKKYGFTIKKSKEYVLNDDIVVDDLKRHFWRGMIDGDGFVSKRDYAHIGLAGTKSVAKGFKCFVEGRGMRCGSVISYDSWYSVSCWGIEAVKVMSLLYDGVNVSLDRKKALVQEKVGELCGGESGCVKIGQNMARGFLKQNHYLKTLPAASLCYGWFEKGLLIGVAAVGHPSSPVVAKEFGVGVIELRRFALSVRRKNLSSKFLAAVIRLLKKSVKNYTVLISYADGAQGHEGTIYKAVLMQEDRRVERQLVGVVGDSRLTGIHLQQYITKYGISGMKFEESPGKIRYVLRLD